MVVADADDEASRPVIDRRRPQQSRVATIPGHAERRVGGADRGESRGRFADVILGRCLGGSAVRTPNTYAGRTSRRGSGTTCPVTVRSDFHTVPERPDRTAHPPSSVRLRPAPLKSDAGSPWFPAGSLRCSGQVLGRRSWLDGKPSGGWTPSSVAGMVLHAAPSRPHPVRAIRRHPRLRVSLWMLDGSP